MSDILRQKLESMPPEQRAMLLQKLQQLSPEQRTQLRERLIGSTSGSQAPTQGEGSPEGLEAYLKPAEAFTEGFGQTATAGYLPQLQAGVEQALPNPTADVDAQLAAQGFNIQQPDSYVESRDRFKKRGNRLKEESPLATGAGQISGAVASSIAASPLFKGTQAASQGTKAIAQAPSMLNAIKEGAKIGGIAGAAYNPGDTEGEINLIQPIERLKGGAIGAATGGALGALGNVAEKLAAKAKNIRSVKNSADLQDKVAAEIQDARKGVDQNYIQPRLKEIRTKLKGKEVSVDPDVLRGINPELDSLADLLAKRRAPQTGTDRFGATFEQPGTRGAVNVKARLADKIRQKVDKAVKYPNQQPFGSTKVPQSREQVKEVADALRTKVQSLDPSLADLFSESSRAIRKSQALGRRASISPIASIKGAPGTDKGALIDWVDKTAGSSLEKTAQGIQSASKDLLNPENLVHPLKAPPELLKMLKRGAFEMGNAADKAKNATQAELSLIELLNEARRKE